MKKLFCVFLSIAVLLSANISAYAAVYDEINKTTEYVYEEKSYQWKCIASHDEMVAAYQIPDDEIKKMSTEMLLSAYLNYPLLIDMFVYNTNEMGFNALKSQCNALNELLSRNDVGEVILDRYEKVKLYDLNSADSASSEKFFEPSALEILAAQPEIIDNMDNNTFVALNNCIYKKCSEKPDDVYSATKYSYFDTLSEISETNPENDNFEKANELIKSNATKAALVLSSDYNWNKTVKTPKGSAVAVGVLKSGKDLSANEKARYKNDIARDYPAAVYVSEATKKYNCHSYAWYSQSTSNGYWMENPSKCMSDGSYKKGGYKVGNIAYYGSSANHSGVVSSVRVGMPGCYIKSKWGPSGVYNHFYNYGPYGSANITYWTKA